MFIRLLESRGRTSFFFFQDSFFREFHHFRREQLNFPLFFKVFQRKIVQKSPCVCVICLLGVITFGSYAQSAQNYG
jgi:hypothetical protein